MKKPYKFSRMKENNILILGGLGFIGSNIAQKCVRLGGNVTIFDAMIEPYGFNLANVREIKDKVKIVKKDMRNFNDLSLSVKQQDCIFNCAGQVSHIDSMRKPFLDVELNIIANLNLLEACRRFNENTKIIYAGTRGQTGKSIYLPVDENHPDNPIDIYGADKLAAEKHTMLYNKVYGIKATSIRLNTTFGERHQMKHDLYGVLNWFIRQCLENKKITVFGKGQQLREYNYVEDAVDAMILAAQSAKSDGEFYMLGAKEPIKFIDMVKEVINACGSGSYEIKPFPEDRKTIEIGDFSVSYKKIKKDLGWQPITPFEEGLMKTVEFYRKNRSDYF